MDVAKINAVFNYEYVNMLKDSTEKETKEIRKLDDPVALWESSHDPDKGFKLMQSVAPDGSHPWYYIKNAAAKSSAVIVPVIKKNGEEHILFLRSLRPPLYAERKSPDSIELPAGFVGDIDKKESVKLAAKREAEEETGYKAQDAEIIVNNINCAPDACNQILSVVKVTLDENEKTEKGPQSDNGVILQRHLVPAKDVQRWLREQAKLGASINAEAMAALFFVAPQYKRLTAYEPTVQQVAGSRFDFVA